MSIKLNESLTKADHSLWFVQSSLQDALAAADPVAAILILQMIAQTSTLKNSVKALQEAVANE